ncbi:hypothetical protein M758_UG184500 [Ceratodon purpureus]|nr:hypothetical protein M758_UG184500 [Ceratodon purpureus]
MEEISFTKTLILSPEVLHYCIATVLWAHTLRHLQVQRLPSPMIPVQLLGLRKAQMGWPVAHLLSLRTWTMPMQDRHGHLELQPLTDPMRIEFQPRSLLDQLYRSPPNLTCHQPSPLPPPSNPSSLPLLLLRTTSHRWVL